MAKQALKAIIMFANLAMAKSDCHDGLQLWTDSFPVQSFAEPSSGLPFFIIIATVFMFGLVIGTFWAWFAIYPYFTRVTLVEPRSNIVPRPTFLLQSLPESSSSRAQAQVPVKAAPPLRRQGSTTTAAGRAASSGAAGPAASSGAAERAAGAASSSAGSSSGDAAAAAAAAAADQRAAGPTSTERSAAAERGNIRSRRSIANQGLPLSVSPMGERYHCTESCKGLRNARVGTLRPGSSEANISSVWAWTRSANSF